MIQYLLGNRWGNSFKDSKCGCVIRHTDRRLGMYHCSRQKSLTNEIPYSHSCGHQYSSSRSYYRYGKNTTLHYAVSCDR